MTSRSHGAGKGEQESAISNQQSAVSGGSAGAYIRNTSVTNGAAADVGGRAPGYALKQARAAARSR